VDAVLVLGDLAGTQERRPYAVPFGQGSSPAAYGLERTVQVALRREVEPNVGRVRGSVQAIRRAVPLTLGEQGVINARDGLQRWHRLREDLLRPAWRVLSGHGQYLATNHRQF